MAKPPGRCIFCGNGGLSKEHIFADWLKELFPRDETSSHTYGTIDPSPVIGVPRISLRDRPGHGRTRKVRVVCKSCNNGWMSALEERTKPMLLPVIGGQRHRLPLEAQELLATWAAKTVMIAEHVRPHKDGISQTDRTFLKDRLKPADNWYVWIATYSGSSWRNLTIYQSRGHLQKSPVGGPGVIKHYIQATTFGVGHLLVLVVNTSCEEVRIALSGRDWNGLLQIWPAGRRSILWPLQRVLFDPQANAVANFLAMSGIFNNARDPLANWTFAI